MLIYCTVLFNPDSPRTKRLLRSWKYHKKNYFEQLDPSKWWWIFLRFQKLEKVEKRWSSCTIQAVFFTSWTWIRYLFSKLLQTKECVRCQRFSQILCKRRSFSDYIWPPFEVNGTFWGGWTIIFWRLELNCQFKLKWVEDTFKLNL